MTKSGNLVILNDKVTLQFSVWKANSGSCTTIQCLFHCFQAIIFFGQVVASYILSFAISLAFEAPVVSLLKIVAPERRKKSQ